MTTSNIVKDNAGGHGRDSSLFLQVSPTGMEFLIQDYTQEHRNGMYITRKRREIVSWCDKQCGKVADLSYDNHYMRLAMMSAINVG